MPTTLKDFLALTKQKGASDLHISASAPVMIRLHGSLVPITNEAITEQDSKKILYEVMNEDHQKHFEQYNDLDFGLELPELGRFRANILRQRKGMDAVFRTIPTTIPNVEELGLPLSVKKLTELNRGLVLVTGPTGSGKSTTLAAMINLINETRKEHIITIEDPIEFVHPNKNCLVNQREVGIHTKSFASALRAALREDPDVILVGEMRDLETISMAITSAETGHLVFGTLHTNSAAKTVDRIIDVFPTNQQAQIKVMLSESLKGVIAQQLLKKKDGSGRVAAHDILIGTSALANLIREGKTFQIPSIMQIGKNVGMQKMDDSLLELTKKGIIDGKEAFNKAVEKKLFEQYLKNA
ncbi:MAG: type IV pilus twitching motility protein PilT [bacterium]